MLEMSFRLVGARLVPRRGARKQTLLLLAALILAGCGGPGKPQTLQAPAFSFVAPGGWHVLRRTRELSASHGDVQLVSVSTFALVKPYRPALYGRVVPELDRVAGNLARGLHGRVTSSEEVTAGGLRGRRYRIAYGRLQQEVSFLLRGRIEYQLLCRFEAGASDSACRTLVETFRLA